MCAKMINTHGIISKTEVLHLFQKKYFSSRISSIYESRDPFPGILAKEGIKKPHYLYLIVNQKHLFKEINLAAEFVENEFTTEYDAAVGHISYKDQTYPVIRLKNLEDLDLIGKLQFALLNHELEFETKLNIEPLHVDIQIKKFFYLTDTGNGIFLDENDKDKGYFAITKDIDHKSFIKYSEKVVKSLPNKIFDAAIGSFYRQGRNTPIIRIFSPSISVDLLAILQSAYEKSFSN